MRLVTLTLMLALGPALGHAQDNTGNTQAGPRVDTNVIGSQEAPSVLNVVPWKDKAVKLEKRDPTSYLRDRVLEPLDRDVLMREVEYYRMLNQESEGDDLFLE